MSEMVLILGLLTLVCLVALGLGFVAIVLRGGSWKLHLGGPRVHLESEVDTKDRDGEQQSSHG